MDKSYGANSQLQRAINFPGFRINIPSTEEGHEECVALGGNALCTHARGGGWLGIQCLMHFSGSLIAMNYARNGKWANDALAVEHSFPRRWLLSSQDARCNYLNYLLLGIKGRLSSSGVGGEEIKREKRKEGKLR